MHTSNFSYNVGLGKRMVSSITNGDLEKENPTQTKVTLEQKGKKGEDGSNCYTSNLHVSICDKVVPDLQKEAKEPMSLLRYFEKLYQTKIISYGETTWVPKT